MREKKPELASFVLIGLVLTSIFAGAVSGAGVGGAEEEIDYPIVSNLKAQSADNPLTITLTPVADATVKSWQPDTNFGSEDVLELSYNAIGEVREAVTLLRFDVASAIPANAIIDSATLELFLVDGAGADPVGVAAYFVTSNWAESRVTWNSFPTAEPIGIISQVDRSPGSYKSWWVTSFAREWHSGSNNGVYLRGPVDGTYYERTFESREHMERVPQLVVTYHLPSPTYTFTGNVYQGSPPDTNTPAGDVTVELWSDEDEWPEAGSERVRLSSTTTDGAGAFSLSWEPGDARYPYLHIIEVDPHGAYSTGAHAEEPGYVKNFNVVSYLDIPPGTYDGIAFWDQTPEEKPDLVIIDVWNVEGRICYQIQNIGEAVAPGGHYTALSVDGVYRVEDCVEEDLAPGAGMERCFEYGWECTPPEDVIVVCADHRGDIEECEEENNCLERIFECAPEEKPDLIITDVWNEDSTICYQIQNIGDGVAPEGHGTALIVDDEYRVSDPVDQDLEHGERLRGCFDYDWECTSPEDIVVVVADHEEGVAEDNETNNHREEIWKCDVTPPQIIHGPIVQEVTRESAVIVWETDEDCDSMVRYGKTARLYDLEEGDSAMVIEHSVTLLRLEPSTTYNFVVRSTDASGNTVVSDEVTFETAHLPDEEDPTVSIIDPGVCRGVVTIEAEAEDNTGVAKVEFYLDDELVFTDHSPPYELTLDTDKYENGEYVLEARAYDLAGLVGVRQTSVDILNLVDATAPTVNIYHPSDGATVSGDQRILVVVEDDTGVSNIEFFIHGNQIAGYNYPTTPSRVEFSVSNPFWWDTRFWENKKYTVAVRATDKDGKTGVDTVNVKVSNPEPPLRPKLVITKHNVTRHKNYFGIDLWVKNEGTARAENIEIRDSLRAFQPISKKVDSVDYKADFNPSTWEGSCIITDTLDLDPGHSRYYTFKAVPVLIHPNPHKPSIGDSIKLTYEGPYGAKYSPKPVGFTIKETTLNYPNVPIATAYNDALKEADYLIVTNRPWLILCNLFQLDDVNTLFSDMAHLATLRNGVLGYFSSPYVSRDTIRDLIKPGGDWAERLSSDFSKPLEGYLLIVGETEIVPAWQQSKIKYSDHPYADTTGSGPPALIVGRVIGDSAANLTKPIQASIGVFEKSPGYAFDRDNALVISDPGIGPFVKTVDTVGTNLLQNRFKNVTKMHWRYYFRVQPPFYRDYEPHDGFAVGDVMGDDKVEIIIGDRSSDKIYIYDEYGKKLNDFDCGFGEREFEKGDRIAVGNLGIVMADSSANRILVYNGYGVLQTSFALDFEGFDGLAVGDVISNSYDEIVIADRSADKIHVYTVGGVKLSKFYKDYEIHDGFAVGDVRGTSKEEIIVADRSKDEIYVFNANGNSFGSFTRGGFDAGDGIAVGNVTGIAKDQILIAKPSFLQRIYIHRWDATKKEWVGGGAIPCDLKKYDGIATGDIGDIMGTQKDEAIIASGDDYIDILDTTNWVQRVRNKFPGLVQDVDVIYFQGHGSPRAWNAPIRTHPDAESVFPIDFNDHNPFVLGTACSTGDYEYGGKLDYKNIAESFLASGAAVYIGSTEESALCYNREAGKKFSKDWNADECVGWAFTDLERDRWYVHGG